MSLLCAAVCIVASYAFIGVPSLPPSTTIPRAKRPAWLREDGIVMAGNWEPLIARARRLNGSFEPTPRQIALYKGEHTETMVRELQTLGVNFVMTHGYKGAGFSLEKPGLEDAKRLAAIAHRHGMRVGLYVFSGTLLPESLSKEEPSSADWEVRGPAGEPVFYAGSVKYRHFMNRNHPAAQAFLKKVVDYAVRAVGADLLHFDNYTVGPGYDRLSVERFRAFLSATRHTEEFGLTSFENVVPPSALMTWRPEWQPTTALHRAWIEFSCDSLALSMAEIGGYARSLKSDILLESNPGAFNRDSAPFDHGRLLRYGEAIWHEVGPSTPDKDGVSPNNIRAYKGAEAMDNMQFMYVTQPADAAEALAYNTDCLGCVAWFEGGKLAAYPDADLPFSPAILPYVRFFHEKRAYYRDAERLPDVGVVRSFASHAFAPESAYRDSSGSEDRFIECNIPWMPVYDHQWGSLARFGCLSLIGADVLSDGQVRLIKGYVRRGGGLIYSEGTAHYDEHMEARPSNPIDQLRSPRAVKLQPAAGAAAYCAAVRRALGRSPALLVTAPHHVTSEFAWDGRRSRRLVHLVNYADKPADGVMVDALVGARPHIRRVLAMSPERPQARSLEFRLRGERVTFSVPRLDRYCLISLEAGR